MMQCTKQSAEAMIPRRSARNERDWRSLFIKGCQPCRILAKELNRMSHKRLLHCQQTVSSHAGRGLIEDVPIHFPACDVAVPVGTRLRRDHGHIRYIAWAETSADSQL